MSNLNPYEPLATAGQHFTTKLAKRSFTRLTFRAVATAAIYSLIGPVFLACSYHYHGGEFASVTDMLGFYGMFYFIPSFLAAITAFPIGRIVAPIIPESWLHHRGVLLPIAVAVVFLTIVLSLHFHFLNFAIFGIDAVVIQLPGFAVACVAATFLATFVHATLS